MKNRNPELNKSISIIMSLVLVLAMFLGISATALADENLVPGPTVMKDPDSPTGYTVRFVYKNTTASSVMFAGDMLLKNWADPTDTKVYQPSEYKPGLMRGGGAYTAPMEKRADGNWVIDVPLAAGANQYWFYVDGNTNLWVTDPANPPLFAPDGLTGTFRRAFNKVNVPYDPIKQNYEPMGAREIENPRTIGNKGTWSYVQIPTQIDNKTRYLGVYVPYGYDPNRAKPYKTIYMQHGYQLDASDWMNIGSVPVIMDNLLQNDQTEPAIVVTTDSTYLGSAATGYPNLFNIIIPFIENTYNVSKNAADRAFAGLSMGGGITTTLINYDATKFGYYGIFSAGMGVRTTTPNLKSCYILVGGGKWDFGLAKPEQVDTLNGYANYKNVVVAGAHDFNTWCQLFTMFARDYLWQPRAFVNSAPVWNPIDNQSVDENRTLTFTAEATDADGDSLVYTASNLPKGASFDPSTHMFAWTPNYTQAGTYVVTLKTSDGDHWYNLSATKDVTITVRNVTVDEQLNGLKKAVAGLGLNKGNTEALTIKLDQVQKLLANTKEEKSAVAIGILKDDFIVQVNNLKDAGKLTKEQTSGLVNAAKETILNISSR